MAKSSLSAEQVLGLLPHRYPVLLVDRVLELSEDEVVAEKLVSANEPYFQGHFPGRPIMPGVLILESLAQAAAIAVRASSSGLADKVPVLAGINRARFRKPVRPGDILTLHATLVRRRGHLFVFEGVARVLGENVAEAELMAALVDWEEEP